MLARFPFPRRRGAARQMETRWKFSHETFRLTRRKICSRRVAGKGSLGTSPSGMGNASKAATSLSRSLLTLPSRERSIRQTFLTILRDSRFVAFLRSSNNFNQVVYAITSSTISKRISRVLPSERSFPSRRDTVARVSSRASKQCRLIADFHPFPFPTPLSLSSSPFSLPFRVSSRLIFRSVLRSLSSHLSPIRAPFFFSLS